MERIKSYESTGVAPNGRLYAGDLNALQDGVAAAEDFAQTISLGTLEVGSSDVQLIKYAAAEARLSAALRTDGIVRALGGLYAGAFTTTQRNALVSPPYGLIILNTTDNQPQWNSGSPSVPAWLPIGIDPTGDVILTGGGSSVELTGQTASNWSLVFKRLADAVARFAIREDGMMEWGPGGATARDTNLYRSAANVLKTDDKFIAGGGLEFGDGIVVTKAYGKVLYSEILPSGNVTTTGSHQTSATAKTIIDTDSLTFDGTTAIFIEFNCGNVQGPGAGSGWIGLFDGSTMVGQYNVGTNGGVAERYLRSKRLVPSAGAHIFSWRSWYNTNGHVVVYSNGADQFAEMRVYVTE